MLANEPASLPRLPGILETVLYCNDLTAGKRFYSEIMNLELYSERENRSVFFKVGDGMLLLFNPENTANIPVPIGDQQIPVHGASGAGHMAFRVPYNQLDEWEKHLQANAVEIEARIEWRSNVESLYFRDPAGNSIELAVKELWFE